MSTVYRTESIIHCTVGNRAYAFAPCHIAICHDYIKIYHNHFCEYLLMLAHAVPASSAARRIDFASHMRQYPASSDPIMLCMHAEMAQGAAVSGSAKWSSAREAPRVLFCMPTSMELVRQVFSSSLRPLENKYPKPKPPACRRNTVASSKGPACCTALAAWAMTRAHVRATMTTATGGATGAIRAIALGKNRFRAMPVSTGTSTICMPTVCVTGMQH
jgi:hypothetical protein